MSPSDPRSSPEAQAPDPAAFLEPSPPPSPVNKVLVIGAVMVLALLVAIGVLTWLSIRDDSSSTGLPTQTSSGDQQQIVNIVNDFIDYTNAGQTSKANELACTGLGLMPDAKDTAPATNPAVVEKITGISVQGDRASAIVTVSSPSTPQVNSQTITMSFLNQGGWKVCKE